MVSGKCFYQYLYSDVLLKVNKNMSINESGSQDGKKEQTEIKLLTIDHNGNEMQ